MYSSRCHMSLLDYLGCHTGTEVLSDLRMPAPGRTRKLVGLLREVPAEAASLREWRDAFQYLTGRQPAQGGPEKIREDLIGALSAAL